MRTAGGRAARDVNLRQRVRGQLRCADRLHAVSQQRLGIPQADLADARADAGDGALKRRDRAVRGERQHPRRLIAREVDDIGALVRGKAHRDARHAGQRVRERAQRLRIWLSADGVIVHGVEARLLLADDPRAASRRAVPLLAHGRAQLRQREVLAGFAHLAQLLQVSRLVCLRSAQRLLQVAGARLAAVFVVAVCAEGQPHRLDVIEDLARRHRLGDQHAEARIVAQAARAVHVEQAVRPRRKAQIAERRVRHVSRSVRKAHLELAGHLLRLDERRQVVARGLRPRQHVEVLPLLHAGERGAHHIARVVAAAAHRDDAMVERALDDVADRLPRQVVQLDGLAGGEVDAPDAVPADHLRRERQLLRRHAARRHAQAQHARLAVALRIGAVIP